MRTRCSLLFGAALSMLLIGQRQALAQSWVRTSAPALPWRSITMSADASKIVAAAWDMNGGYIYYSTNGGATWMAAGVPVANWISTAGTADGARWTAALLGGVLYSSTDSGATWTPSSSPSDYWNSIACSSDGSTMVGASTMVTGRIYASTDSGTNWVAAGPAAQWHSVACSANGTKMIAAAEYGALYMSWNSGASWSPLPLPADADWFSVACTADGTKLAAVTDTQSGVFAKPSDSSIYLSTNGGLSWSRSPMTNNWWSVACSADGTKLVAAGRGTPICTSTNWGVTLTPEGGTSNRWQCVSVSADGNKVLAGAEFDGIYIWQGTPKPVLSVRTSGGAAEITWPIPSMKFLLQQTPDLNSTNWTVVTNAPAITNLQYQVSLPAAFATRFYRLALP